MRFSNRQHTCHKHCHINVLPATKLILGAAVTVFLATPGTAGFAAVVVTVFTGVVVDAVVPVVLIPPPTTTGSVDGIGFPSFVCSFTT
jgi:hypothetical protein